jgi:hypothetical protein
VRSFGHKGEWCVGGAGGRKPLLEAESPVCKEEGVGHRDSVFCRMSSTTEDTATLLVLFIQKAAQVLQIVNTLPVDGAQTSASIPIQVKKLFKTA